MSVKNRFSFIIFSNMHSMKDVMNVHAIEFLDVFDLIHDFDDEI